MDSNVKTWDDGRIGPTQVAQILGVSRNTAWRLIKNGDIPSAKTPGGHSRCWPVDVFKYKQELAHQCEYKTG